MSRKFGVITLLFLVFIIHAISVLADNEILLNRDSLRRVLNKKDITDTARINTLYRLGKSYDYYLPDSMDHYASMVKTASQKVNYRKGLMEYFTLKGLVLQNTGKWKEALEYHLQALDLAEKTRDNTWLFAAYNNLGNDYMNLNILDKALNCFNTALDISRNMKQTPRILLAMLNLALVYEQAGDLNKSIEYNLRIISMYDSIGFRNPSMKAAVMHNLAENYLNSGRLGESMDYLLKAYALNKEYKNRTYLKINLLLLGNLFEADKENKLAGKTGSKMSSNDLAFSYCKELEGLCLEDKDTSTLVLLYNNMSQILADRGNLQEALQYGVQSWKMRNKNEDPDLKAKIAEGIANISYALGDYKNAADFFRIRNSIKDSLETAKIAESVRKLSESHEIAIKDEQLKEKEQQLRAKEFANYLLFTLAALILVFASVLFYSYKQKQKAARELELKNIQIGEARSRAERNEKFKEQFLANMSHEIRTPLNAVIGITDLMLDEKQAPKTEIFLKNIKQAGEHLLVLINDILDLSKVEAGKLELMDAPFNLDSFIAGINDLFRYKMLEKDLKMLIDISETTPKWLSGDSSRIRQVLVNLVGNAVKFTDKGSVRIKIDPQEYSGDHCKLKFSVEDTGPGIAKDQQAVIFEEFIQIPGTNDQVFRGTGLGLSISRKLVERMGGKLKVESQPGSGSVFFFTIPLAVSSEEAFNTFRKENLMPAEARKGAFRILVVEDNPSNLVVTEGHLEKILPESIVKTAENGKIALEMLEKENFELVLMDVQMPVMDGYTATRKIREMQGEMAHIPVIALTASMIRADIRKCLEAGMNAYVPKPVNRKVLAKTIFEQLGISGEPPMETVNETANNFLENLVEKPFWTSSLYEACNGKKSRFIRYLELFLLETDKELTNWDQWIAARRQDELAASVHKLNSHIRIFTDKNTVTQSTSLEDRMRTGWDPDYAESLLSLQQAINKAKAEAREVMKKLV
jgi:signal transduction histidine kinase/tetratricopeptide (TPR) repeat protein/FixJ family two-component response regulator